MAQKLTFFAQQLYTLYQLKFSNLRQVLSITFPQKFWISKNFGHLTLGSGGKKTFKQYIKSEHTDKHTDKRTDILTYKKHRLRGPMLWKELWAVIFLKG